MSKPEKNKPAPAAAADDMDGGFTMADGQKMRIVLDGRGVFKALIPAGSSLPAPSSLDEASARAAASMPIAKTGGAGGQGEDQGGQAGGPGAAGGFKAPT